MKQAFLLVLWASVLSPGTAHAMANPASVFCATMNGRTVTAKLPDGGAIGLCYLPNQKIVEEWTLFRMLDGKTPTPDNNPFR